MEEGTQKTLRDRVAEAIKDVPMPEAQRHRILERIEQLSDEVEVVSWETTTVILQELAFQILREFNGVTEIDLGPLERRKVEEFVDEAFARIFP